MRSTLFSGCPATRGAVVSALLVLLGSFALATPAHASTSQPTSTTTSTTTTAGTTSSFFGPRVPAKHLRSRSAIRARTVAAPVTARIGAAPAPEPTTATVPAGAVSVAPGQDLAALVAAHPIGSAFVLRAGVHRLQAVEPKDGMTFVGEPGAVLSGARVLSGFTASGGAWYVGGQAQQGARQGECRSTTPLCNHPDRVFLDGTPLTPVATREALRPGSFYFDYAADRIWIGSDPSGRLVEASATPRAFFGRAIRVTVRALTVQMYATPAQRGAVDASDGTNWLIDGVTARLNAGGGLRGGNGTTIRASRAIDNAQIGVTGVGTGITIDGTEIARNNTAGYEPGWEAGGTKFALTDGLVVRNSNVHSNDGPGLWTDVDNVRTTYDGNTVAGNRGEGIFHEISGSAVIRNNVVRGNGVHSNPWVWGAGIHVASSFDVEIYGNRVEGNGNGIVGSQQNRGDGPHGPRLLRNLNVHDNTVASSGKVGVAQDVSDRSIFSSRGIVFARNSYGPGQVFTWMDRDVDLASWRAFGLDVAV